MKKPTFWKLCGAYLVDVVLCQVVGFFAGGLAGGIVGFILGATGMYTPEHILLFTVVTGLAGGIAGLICFVFYFAACEARWGKTLGKKLTGLQVVQTEKGE